MREERRLMIERQELLPGRLVWAIMLPVILACQPLRGESLDAIVAVVSRKFEVREIDTAALIDSMTAERRRVVLFDVREPEEFRVGHIQDAIRVDPEMGAQRFLEQYGDKLQDGTAVFYCSVGYRSSALAEKLVEATGDSGRVVNLRGGIFKWYNEGRTVYDSTGVTDRVHPYSEFWGRLLRTRSVPGRDQSGVPGSK